MTSEDKRFHQLERKVGIFAAVGLLGAALAIAFMAWENGFFTRKYQLTMTVEKGTGLTRGMPVKLSGFRIGRVSSLSLNDRAAVDVILKVDRKYQQWIREDSQARVIKEGLIGDLIIEISGGSASSRVLTDKETLRYVKTKGLDELADEVVEKVRPVLLEIRDVIGYVNDPEGDVKQAVRNIGTLAKNLESTRQQADALLVTARRETVAMSEKMTGAITRTEAAVMGITPILEKTDNTVAVMNDRLPDVLDKVDSSLTNLERVTLTVRETADRTLPRMPRMVRKGEDVLTTTGTVMDAVKGMWPLRSAIPVPPEQLFIRGDSRE